MPRSTVRHQRPATLCHHRARIEGAIKHLRAHHAEAISLETLASVAGMSREHLCRVFLDLTGISPFRYLSAVRIAAAKRLLLQTGKSVTEVCFEVGYTSLGTFIHRFKAAVGRSPGQFRTLAAALVANADRTPVPGADHRARRRTPPRTAHRDVMDLCGARVLVLRSPDPLALADASVSFADAGPDGSVTLQRGTGWTRALRAPDTLVGLLEGAFPCTSALVGPDPSELQATRVELRMPQLTDLPVVLCIASKLLADSGVTPPKTSTQAQLDGTSCRP